MQLCGQTSSDFVMRDTLHWQIEKSTIIHHIISIFFFGITEHFCTEMHVSIYFIWLYVRAPRYQVL